VPVSNPLQPLIVIDTGQYRYERSMEVEPHRVIIASIITLLLAYTFNCLYNERGISFTLAVIAPLGGEADFVIAVLGREYYPSIYFKEPELLNVQLSRHRLMLTVIGSIEYFYHSAKQFNIDKQNKELRLATTLEQLIDLVERYNLKISYCQ
jgi:hypothetical protein